VEEVIFLHFFLVSGLCLLISFSAVMREKVRSYRAIRVGNLTSDPKQEVYSPLKKIMFFS